MCTSDTPLPFEKDPKSLNERPLLVSVFARCKNFMSPYTMIRARCAGGSSARARQMISGPTPAGSPIVMPMRGPPATAVLSVSLVSFLVYARLLAIGSFPRRYILRFLQAPHLQYAFRKSANIRGQNLGDRWRVCSRVRRTEPLRYNKASSISTAPFG